MKIFIAVLILSIDIIGCKPSYDYPSKKINVALTNGISRDYGLLSVRGDSAIVVLDWQESEVRPIPLSHAELITKKAIVNISRAGDRGGVANSVAGTLVGALAGGIVALPFSQARYIGPMATGMGILSGSLIGLALGSAHPATRDLSLEVEDDRSLLRSISLYPEQEPAELRSLK